MTHKIGIIGFGNMGSAIAERLKNDYKVAVFEKDPAKTGKATGIHVAKDLHELINESDTLILAIKPQDFPQVFIEIKNSGHQLDKLVISIAAGIPVVYIEEHFGAIRVIRAMPNMPAKIGAGITCLAKGRFASAEDLGLAKELFGYLGETLSIKEDLMNAATAIVGSGPGFLYDLIEGKSLSEAKKYSQGIFTPLLKEAAMNSGFSEDEAGLMAEVTAAGSIAVLEKTKTSPQELASQVVSKGGTTEAGLAVLHHGGTLAEAVSAALKRADELSRRG